MGLFRKTEIERLSELLLRVKKLEFNVIRQPINVQLEQDIKDAEKVDYEVIALLLELLRHGKVDKQAGITIIKELEQIEAALKKINKNKIKNPHILEEILKTLEYFITMEKKYIYKEPGFEAGGYIRLEELLLNKQILHNGGVLRASGNALFYNERQIGGAKLIGERIALRAEHYSTKSALSQIARQFAIEVSPEDPYSYLVESGPLAKKTEQEIKHALGIKKNITGKIVFMAFPPISRTWIKCNPGKPARFAIEGELNIKAIKKGKQIIVELF